MLYLIHYQSQQRALQKMQALSEKAQAQNIQSLKSLGPLIVDPEGFKTENNWLAATISREIAEMAFITVHPDQPLPDLKIKAEVDSAKPSVHVVIEGFGAGDDSIISMDLSPAFAWDAPGYAPLAERLLGGTVGLTPGPGTDSTDVLSHLLNLTGTEIALEDIRLSNELQQHPASWQDHEAAALVLTAMALRESDDRVALSRIAAHLALAQALRSNQSPTWPGLVADAALRTLSGREIDALTHLDVMEVRADCPDSAKTWISALRILAKQNWKVIDVTAKSPLLLKIIWFNAVAQELSDVAAVHRLDQVVLQSLSSNSSTPNPEAQLTDWARAIMREGGLSVQNSQRFAGANMDLEFQELADVLKIETDEKVDQQNLAAVLVEDEGKTVSSNANSHASVHIIGPGIFKADSRRHLFAYFRPTYEGIRSGLGDIGEADTFGSKMDVLFRGVYQYELTRNGTREIPLTVDDLHAEIVDLNARKVQWPVWDGPLRMDDRIPGASLIKDFYAEAVPFGTAHNLEARMSYIDEMEMKEFLRTGGMDRTIAWKKIQALPEGKERSNLIKATADEQNAHPERYEPQGPMEPAKQLLQLAPDQYVLVTSFVRPEHLMAVTESFLDHDTRSIRSIERLTSTCEAGRNNTIAIDPMVRERILTKQALLEPDTCFMLAYLLRQDGKEDEAAAMDRKGFAEAYDEVGISNSVCDLVVYDIAHGLTDEAQKVSLRAFEVGSAGGMEARMTYLEGINQLDDAEECARQVEARYNNEEILTFFYARHQDRYPEKYKEAEQKIFPDGLRKAGLDSFKDKPEKGCQITGNSLVLTSSPLKEDDVIVAVDGFAIDSEAQYVFVRGFTKDPNMDFIVWRENAYLGIKASFTGRRFYTDIHDYRSR